MLVSRRHSAGLGVATIALLVAMAGSGPASAAAAPTAEPTSTVTGELVTVVDGPQQESRVRIAGGAFVPVTDPVVRQADPGSKIAVTVPRRVIDRTAADRSSGFTPQRDLAPSPTGTVVSPPPATTTPTTATHQVTMAIVVPNGVTGTPATEAQARTQLDSASQYWSQQSAGKVRFAAAKVSPTLNLAAGCNDYWSMWQEAASRTGFTPGKDRHLVLVMPRTATSYGCSYGLGSVGSGVSVGGYVYVSDTAWPVLAHELGHNLGLQHAQRLICPTVADVSLAELSAKGCQVVEYGDPWDIMAASAPNNAGSLSSPQAYRLGLWDPAAVTQVTSGSVTATLKPVAGGQGVRAVRVVDPKTGVAYFVEYRTRAGRDYLLYANMAPGVRVLREDTRRSSLSRPTLALDASPTGSQRDYAWGVGAGSSFTSYGGGVRISVSAADDTSAKVVVSTGAAATAPVGTPAAAPAPSTSLPTSQSSVAGGLVDLGKRTGVTQGTWFDVPASPYAFGTAMVTSSAGASWSVVVEGGRVFDLIGTAFPAGARGRILVDGRAWADFDSYRPTSATPYQQVLRSITVPAGKHTVTVVSAATPSRPVLALDAYRMR